MSVCVSEGSCCLGVATAQDMEGPTAYSKATLTATQAIAELCFAYCRASFIKAALTVRQAVMTVSFADYYTVLTKSQFAF